MGGSRDRHVPKLVLSISFKFILVINDAPELVHDDVSRQEQIYKSIPNKLAGVCASHCIVRLQHVAQIRDECQSLGVPRRRQQNRIVDNFDVFTPDRDRLQCKDGNFVALGVFPVVRTKRYLVLS